MIERRRLVTPTAAAVLDHLALNAPRWADAHTFDAQIDAANAKVREAVDRIEDAPLPELRAQLVEAAARLIDAASELDRMIAAGDA